MRSQNASPSRWLTKTPKGNEQTLCHKKATTNQQPTIAAIAVTDGPRCSALSTELEDGKV
jgi:hypothetical protein